MKDANTSKLTVITVLCSVLFFLALTLLEAIPEIPVDIDFKPFFIPLAFIALLPTGKPSWAVGFGAALGEALRDILEGYEREKRLYVCLSRVSHLKLSVVKLKVKLISQTKSEILSGWFLKTIRLNWYS